MKMKFRVLGFRVLGLGFEVIDKQMKNAHEIRSKKHVVANELHRSHL